ncbi:hypothetical protein DPMN_078866 [Dreissena polymorpha]|uniref:Uncharacterized protein n=1 Tax=Dreissena polymorpha TaxID=45954 RepID=A0A9D4BPJ0_DREPO|nr:hypothetical protein DPMN_078866 [Dreissena polymorpha]
MVDYFRRITQMCTNISVRRVLIFGLCYCLVLGMPYSKFNDEEADDFEDSTVSPASLSGWGLRDIPGDEQLILYLTNYEEPIPDEYVTLRINKFENPLLGNNVNRIIPLKKSDHTMKGKRRLAFTALRGR